MNIFSVLFSCFAFIFFIIAPLNAAPPATMTYQGKLKTTQGVLINTPTTLTFRIYDVATGGTKLWEETLPSVTVVNGHFTVILGKMTSLATLAFDKTYYLSMQVNTDSEMTPRIEMTSAPYAMNTVKQSSAGAADLYVKTITTPKNVTISPSGSGQASVTWNAVEGATSYNLYLATESGVNASNYQSKANGKAITGVTSPYTVTGLTNAPYFFSMASVTPVGESVTSVEVKATSASQITNSLGMIFKPIPAGTFSMGCTTPSTSGDTCFSDGREAPAHQVTLKAFYIQTTEVTQGQWKTLMGTNPSSFSTCGDTCPVENVSWTEIQTFLVTLNAKGEGTYRLPTEAEWEYAARAGTTTAYSFGNDASKFGDYGWYSSNSSSKTHPVASKLPNPWGLYDMHGNVWEWVSDWYGNYASSSEIDPVGPSSGSIHVGRGGGWFYGPGHLRSAFRYHIDPGFQSNSLGFRLAMVP